MTYFVNHKLIKVGDGYIAELYLDKQLNEFSLDFLGIGKKTQAKDKGGLEKAVKDYIDEKLPNLKIKAVHIMLGTLLVASLPYGSALASAPQASVSAAVQNRISITYTIKAGDTLYLIAKKFGTNVSVLKSANGLTGDLIYAGRKLHIPETLHKVQGGDTLYKISMKFNISLAQLKMANRLTSDVLYIGQTLKIPHIVKNADSSLALVNKKNNLPSGYVPANMVVPKVAFVFKEYDDKKLMRPGAASALEEMFNGAKAQGIYLYAVSGYRSFSRQQSIFASSAGKHGEEKANQLSARPGQSEHQTGLAMDLTSASVNYVLSQAFGDTKEGQWLKENAYKYGFIIRYQRGKEYVTGYQYEPWHIRFVGKAAAKEITRHGLTLEEYLGIL